MLAGFDRDEDEGEPLELGELGGGIDWELLGMLWLGEDGDCDPWEGLGGEGVGKPLALAGLDWEAWGDCCELCCCVSQAASPAIRPQPSTSRIREAELMMEPRISLPLPVNALPMGSRLP